MYFYVFELVPEIGTPLYVREWAVSKHTECDLLVCNVSKHDLRGLAFVVSILLFDHLDGEVVFLSLFEICY